MSLPKILYHGTAKKYHDEQVKNNGVFKHNSEQIHMTDSYFLACSHALVSAQRHSNETPIILTIESSKISNIIPKPEDIAYLTKELPTDSYKIEEVKK